MATYYVDPWTGSDANNATQAQSTSTPWKTLIHLSPQGAYSTLLSPGDTVKVRGVDPYTVATTGDYAWSTGSSKLTCSDTLSVALVTNLLNSDTVTLYSSTTSGASSSYYHDPALSSARALTIPSGLVGKFASVTTGGVTLDSACVGFSFLFRLNTSVAGWIPSAKIQIKLCSDTAGDTSLLTLDIPTVGALAVNKTIALYIPATHAGITVNSVGFYTKESVGASAVSVTIENLIQVVNGAGETDQGFRHFDLTRSPDGNWHTIGAFGNDHAYMRFTNTASVDLTLVNNPTASPVAAQMLRTADWDFQLTADGSGNINFNAISGTTSSPIVIQGGYDATFTTISGYSVWNGRGNLLGSLRFGALANVTFSRIGFSGYNTLNFLGATENVTFSDCFFNYTATTTVSCIATGTAYMVNCNFYDCHMGYNTGTTFSPNGWNVTVEDCTFTRASTFNLSPLGYLSQSRFKNCSFSNPGTNCMFLGSGSARNLNEKIIFDDCSLHCTVSKTMLSFSLPGGTDPMVVFNDLTYSGLGTLVTLDMRTPGLVFFRNLVNNSTTGLPVTSIGNAVGWPTPPKLLATIQGYTDNVSSAGYGADYILQIFNDTTSVKNLPVGSTAAPTPNSRVWEITTGTSNTSEARAFYHRLGFYKVTAGAAITFACHGLLNDVDGNMKLVIRNYYSDGGYSSPELESSVVTSYNTWETPSVTFTPTLSGNVELAVKLWRPSGTGVIAYVGNVISIT